MNCILIDDDEMSRRVIEEYASKVDFVNILNSFSNPVDALNFVRNNPDNVNLIFLDIEMPEMNGMEFLEATTNSPQVIIISSKDKYALKAFDYSVTDYLLKPVMFPRFFKAVSKAYEKFNKQRSASDLDKEIFVKKNNTLIRIKYGDILWVEALENYIVINTPNERFTIHLTMKSIENQLPIEKFKRIHRSYIVNISRIESIEDNSVVIRTNEGRKIIPIGKSYRDKLLNELNLLNK
ncbi:MAG: response regulator transcription factor [Bacteroidales bacterium]|nr:response regulator transcription factor [Bacteroidales bacterium]HPD96464.1 LytTR family DNA-binding domain-containing protein [Tenuifilaceae bacterium]HRX30730.1 LytTR family DNA-binding domain-containing protein [Tenuifilaceae bacterium]